MSIKRRLTIGTLVLVSVNIFDAIAGAEEVQQFHVLGSFKTTIEASGCTDKLPSFCTSTTVAGHVSCRSDSFILDCICGNDGKLHC
jgi:hypothetical protein